MATWPDEADQRRALRPIRKLRVCLTGFLYAVRVDRSVAYKSLLSVASLSLCVAYHELIDFLLVLVATALMLGSEMLNTSIERLCDFIEEGHDEQIGRIKDVAAAASGVAGFVWAVVVVAETVRLLGRG